MNNTDAIYTQFALCREMLETADVIRRFEPDAGKVASKMRALTKPL